VSSDIPAARGLLREVAAALEEGSIPTRTAAIRIRAALAHMTRATPARRAPRQSAPMTAQLAAEVRAKALTSRRTMHDIAAEYGVSQGRVSEAVNGKR
jgi:hypothetical protein